MRTALLVVLVSSAVAQTPPPARATFHLPAGDHSVSQLLHLAGQAVKKPIGTKEVDNLAEKPPIRLQVDLALAGDDFEDVLGALLSTRGLTLARSEDLKGYEVLPEPRGDAPWIRDRAIELAVADLHRRAGHAGPVRVAVPTSLEAARIASIMRAQLAGTNRTVKVDAGAAGVVLVGLADAVRFAVAQIAMMDPTFAATLPARPVAPWPRAASASRHELPAGRYSARELVDRLAKALVRQHVLAAALATEATLQEPSIDVPEAILGDEFAFEDRITALLWRDSLLLVPVAEPGVYEVLRVTGPQSAPSPSRSTFVSAAEVLARPGRVAWISVEIELAGRDAKVVVDLARETLRGIRQSAVGLTMVAERVFLSGNSDELAKVLPKLTESH